MGREQTTRRPRRPRGSQAATSAQWWERMAFKSSACQLNATLCQVKHQRLRESMQTGSENGSEEGFEVWRRSHLACLGKEASEANLSHRITALVADIIWGHL